MLAGGSCRLASGTFGPPRPPSRRLSCCCRIQAPTVENNGHLAEPHGQVAPLPPCRCAAVPQCRAPRFTAQRLARKSLARKSLDGSIARKSRWPESRKVAGQSVAGQKVAKDPWADYAQDAPKAEQSQLATR